MKHVKTQFKSQLAAWRDLLLKANLQDSPALWLVRNNGRTTLFYLQAMTRVLAAQDDKKTWLKLNARFKSIEDVLGKIDYFEGLLKDFKSNRNIPRAVKTSLDAQRNALVQVCDALLEKDGWLSVTAPRFDKIKKQLKEVTWPTDARFQAKLHAFYTEKLNAIHARLSEPLEDLEADVHELRRDVRWLSIYPQAFKGFVVLRRTPSTAAKWAKYRTPEILNSPFNQLALVPEITCPIVLNDNQFYAMSWLISTLGGLKDSGLRVEALSHELQILSSDVAQDALPNTGALGRNQPSVAQILDQAHMLAKQLKRDAVFSTMLVDLPAKN